MLCKQHFNQIRECVVLSIEFEYFAMISLKALNRAATLSDSRLKFNNKR